MSFDLNLNDIKVICGSLIYNRAIDMYLRNKVRTVSVIKNTENNFEAAAVVQSEYDINNYEISIKIDNMNMRIYPSCTCTSFDTYHMCKHIGAVLIKLQKEGIDDKGASFLKTSEEELLDSYKNIFEKKAKGIEKEYLTLGVKLIADEPYYRSGKKKFYIELKIGNSKMYVVKNIRELIENVFISGGTISFGKELEYNSCRYDFYEEDKKLLAMLKEIYDMNMEVSEKLYTNKTIFFTGKRAFMSEGSIRKLFDIKKGRKIEMDFMGEKYTDVELVKGNLPVSFYMFMDSDKLSIDMNGDVPKIISEEYGLYYLNNKLYMLSYDENCDFAPLLKVFNKKHDNTISFEQKEISDVANYLLPKLKEISPVVMQDESVSVMLHEEPLETGLYLDKDGDKIKCGINLNMESMR